MLVYSLVILSVSILSLLAKLKWQDEDVVRFNGEKIYNPYFIILIWLVLGLVSGLRWKVGTDYRQYSINYSIYKELPWSSSLFWDEPGLKVISKISSLIYDDFSTMFLIASLITTYLMVKTISKNSSMLTFSILLLIFTGVWHGSFNAVRQYLAASIIFAGHKYIVNKNFMKFLLTIIIASTFHVSALVFIFLYFIPTRKINKKELIILMIATLLFIVSYDFLIDIAAILKNESIVITDYVLKEVNTLRVLTKIAPVIFYFLFTQKRSNTNKENFYINLMFVNAALVLATSNSAYLSRIWIYTDLFSVLFFPVLLQTDDKRLKLPMTILILLIYYVFWFYEVIITSNLYNFNWVFER